MAQVCAQFTVASEERTSVQRDEPGSDVCGVCCSPAVEAVLGETSTDPTL